MSSDSCVYCGQASTGKCSRCRSTTYCGRQCQLKDWETHALQCSDKTMSVDLGRDSKRSALEYIKQERKFTELFNRIAAAKLQQDLAEIKTVTVFAPSNKAFQRLEKIWKQYQLDDLYGYMADIVQYHVVPEKLTFDMIAYTQAQQKPIPSLLFRNRIGFYYDDASRELTLNRTIRAGKPIVVTNGLIYPIDDVLLPTYLEKKLPSSEPTYE